MQFLNTLTAADQELYENVKGLFDFLSEKFKTQHSDPLLSLQYCKLIRNWDESAK